MRVASVWLFGSSPGSLPAASFCAITGHLAATAFALMVVAGCARKLPPSGGPPDIEPPSVLSVTPDSGATAVSRSARFVVEFSEGMDPVSASTAVEIAPAVDIKQRHWSGRRLWLVPRDSLRAEQTYTIFIGTDARDRHGNGLRAGRAVPFTTALAFPSGLIEGQVVATGFSVPGTYLW